MGAELSKLIDGGRLITIHASEVDSQSQLDALVSEAVTMQQDIENAAARCTSLELLLDTLQSESEILLKQDAAPAMDTLLVLVDHIESLHRFTKNSTLTTDCDPPSTLVAIQARAPLVNACKLQSQVVFGHFQSLSEKAKGLTQRFTELATDFTFQITSAQGRMERLQNMVQIAETLRNGVECERQSWHDQKATAEVHIQQARETIWSAERKRESIESARVVRNIFTFGLGEAFDFFDLNKEIEDAGRTIASAEQNARACEESIRRAVAAVQRINNEVARLNTLGGTVQTHRTTLEASVIHGQALRTRTIDLTNASLDVSLFVGTLAAKSETFATHHTAPEFARSVLNFGRLMVLEGRLNGLLVECDPGELQETLDLIAHAHYENGRSIEDIEDIEDMM